MKILVIQPLTTAQISEILALDRLCFGGFWSQDAYLREIDSPKSSLLALWVREIQQPGSSSNFKHQDLQAVGMGCLWSIVEEAHITLLGIHPDYRRQGLGEFLLCNLLKDALERQLKWATLEVKTNNSVAISLYEKFGFKIVGKRQRYYQKTGEDAFVLWYKGLDKLEFQQNLSHRQQKNRLRLSRNYIFAEK